MPRTACSASRCDDGWQEASAVFLQLVAEREMARNRLKRYRAQISELGLQRKSSSALPLSVLPLRADVVRDAIPLGAIYGRGSARGLAPFLRRSTYIASSIRHVESRCPQAARYRLHGPARTERHLFNLALSPHPSAVMGRAAIAGWRGRGPLRSILFRHSGSCATSRGVHLPACPFPAGLGYASPDSPSARI
jgi:hypothetical protein